MSTASYCYRLRKAQEYSHSVKGSKFLAYAYPVTTIEAAEGHLQQLMQTHHKARHHCYAYRLGAEGDTYRANDAGEPSGTAGLPIYNQIQSFEFSDIMLIVVRYFGGTLLGAPGLVRAYKDAAYGALVDAPRQRIVPLKQFAVVVEYASVNTLMQIIERHNISIIKQDMAMQCTYTLQCPRDEYQAIQTAMAQTREITLQASD